MNLKVLDHNLFNKPFVAIVKKMRRKEKRAFITALDSYNLVVNWNVPRTFFLLCECIKCSLQFRCVCVVVTIKGVVRVDKLSTNDIQCACLYIAFLPLFVCNFRLHTMGLECIHVIRKTLSHIKLVCIQSPWKVSFLFDQKSVNIKRIFVHISQP